MTSHLRLNSRLLPALVLLLLVLQIINPAPAWKTLLVILGGGWLTGWLWARGLARGLRFTREMRYGWAQVGDELEERFTLINNSVFPATWVEVDDYSSLPDYHISQATFVDGVSSIQFTTHGVCSRRGLYSLGGTSLRSGDPLGLYTVQIDNPFRQTVLVMPPVVPLPSIDVTPGGFMGGGRPRSHSPELSAAAAGVRQYQPGDPVRMMHWPTTARLAQLFVRTLEGTPAADWWILLDLDASVQTGAGWDSTVEHAIVLAASLADSGLRSRKNVGLALNSQEAAWLPPRANQNQRWAILQALALAQPGELGLRPFLERSGKAFGRQCSLVVITPNLQAGWVEALAQLQWGASLVPTILLLDPVSFGGKGDAPGLAARLQALGMNCHLIDRELLDRPEARPGQNGRWEFMTSATGKAIPRRKPANMDWKRLV